MPPRHKYVYITFCSLLFVAAFSLCAPMFLSSTAAGAVVVTVHAQSSATAETDSTRGVDTSTSAAVIKPIHSLEEVMANAEAKLASIDAVELLVELEQYSPADGSVTQGKGRLSARLPDLFRFDWLQPDMMAGSILLVDKQKNEAHQYNPIREEIIVQRWDTLAAQQNLAPEIDRWLALPSPDDFALQAGGVETINGQANYVIAARPHESPEFLYEFLISPETWLISHFRQYDSDGRLALRGSLTDVRINGDLLASKISAMPPFARVRYR